MSQEVSQDEREAQVGQKTGRKDDLAASFLVRQHVGAVNSFAMAAVVSCAQQAVPD